MQLKFDIRKTIAAVAFLMDREGGQLDMFLGLKMLYLADKEALIRWGKTITGDSFVSMPKGPVLSIVYNLFKKDGPPEYQREWDGLSQSASIIPFDCLSPLKWRFCLSAKWSG